MNFTKETWARLNTLLRQHMVDRSQLSHISCIRQHPTESDGHFYEKVRLAREAFKNNKPFLTECWVENNSRRYDFFDLHDGIVTEIETDPKVTKAGAETVKVEKEGGHK